MDVIIIVPLQEAVSEAAARSSAEADHVIEVPPSTEVHDHDDDDDAIILIQSVSSTSSTQRQMTNS